MRGLLVCEISHTPKALGVVALPEQKGASLSAGARWVGRGNGGSRDWVKEIRNLMAEVPPRPGETSGSNGLGLVLTERSQQRQDGAAGE